MESQTDSDVSMEFDYSSGSDDNSSHSHPREAVGAYEMRAGYQSDEGCIYVFDTCFILEADEWRKFPQMLQKHLLIIPKIVLMELQCHSRDGSKPAKSVIDMLENSSGGSRANERPQSGNFRRQISDAGSPETAHGCTTGIRLQRSKEKDKNVLSAARNNDDHILSCACFFRRRHKPRTFLVTLDSILELKAHAEGVETLSSLP
ncbi:PIN domain [Trypanosoma vivax]|uniref:PIN domain-containing protein n=1 Tax=Trypanosoma vivax (strain Y486) TaxID=1055687 RepID=G0TR72_TRYVY|nr:hypothetical protein TRVL_06228 [Trypanosoma vivax]KAH8611964.1 PIN domain [Trypanosoma vivax]CCC46436.1 conserved hypothetical protein [Trypanosoma vivax Y486]